MTFLASISESPYTGGAAIRMTGTALDVSGCSDDFGDGSLGALWTDISSGTGSADELVGENLVRLDTGTTAGSIAGIQTVDTGMLDVDVAASWNVTTLTRPAGGWGPPDSSRVVLAELSLDDLAVTLQIGTTAIGRDFTVIAGGVTTTSVIGSIPRPNERVLITLRLLRALNQVWVYRNGTAQVRFQTGAITDTTRISMRVRNDPSLSTRVVAELFNYVRLPVVRFDSFPIEDLVASATANANGTTPAVTVDTTDTTVYVTSCTGAATNTSQVMTFTYPQTLRRAVEPFKQLIVTNDPQLKYRRGTSG